MNDCVFCNIVNKTLLSEILYESENLIVIRDLLPKAPIHLLIIPKKHVLSINHMQEQDQPLLGEMAYTAKLMGEKFGVSESGYKLVFNIGRDGGEVIAHLHMHLLGGKKLGE